MEIEIKTETEREKMEMEMELGAVCLELCVWTWETRKRGNESSLFVSPHAGRALSCVSLMSVQNVT